MNKSSKLSVKIPKSLSCKCHIRPKTRVDFHLNRANKDGFNSVCKSCKLSKKRGWYGRQKEYQKERYHSDADYNIKTRVRSRIKGVLKDKSIPKTGSTRELLGCSWSEFQSWIKAQFVDGMNWDLIDSGEIHIDHIIPINFFDFTDNTEVLKAFHFTNTRPMWAKNNLFKSDKIIIDGREISYSKARGSTT